MVVEDRQQRLAAPFGVLVGLVEQPGDDAGTEAEAAVVLDRRVAGEKAQEVALAGAVGAEDGDPLAEVDLEVERIGQPVERELFDDERPPSGARPAETHRDALLADVRRALLALEEVTQAALGSFQLRGEDVGGTGAAAHLGDEVLEVLVLLVVLRSVSVELVEVCPPGSGVAGEPATERPRAVPLDRHDLRRRGGQQLAIVTDVQHRLARRLELALEPALGIDVEEVVGFVEEQDLGVAAQQHLQGEALLLAA